MSFAPDFRTGPADGRRGRLANLRVRMMWTVAALAALGWPTLAGAVWGQAAEGKHRQALAGQGIDPSPAGLRQFFRDIAETSFDDEALDRLIEQLGSDDYAARVDAQRKLICQPRLPIEKLQAASQSTSPEQAYRARVVLQTWQPARRQLVEAALRLVAEQQVAGLVPELLATARAMPDLQTLWRAFETALPVSATQADQAVLQAALDDPNPLVARLAMTGLVQLSDATQVDQLLSWATRTQLDPQARIAAAARAIDLSDRRALRALVTLIQTEQDTAAVQAHVTLKRATGQRIPLVVSDPRGREQCVAAWTTWLDQAGDTCSLNIPLATARLGRSVLQGNTLIASGYRNEVIELDSSGNEVWKYTAQGAWSAEKLVTGNYLIASYQQNKILIVSPEKTVVWDYDFPGVLNARALENGNILAASHSENRVEEIDEAKNVVWKYSANSQCHDALRLENGNTLICTNDEVLEVDPRGEAMWRYAAPQAYGVDVLDNGNILVAHLNGSVVEVTRDQNIVWSYRFPSPVDVFRTEAGTTIITGSQSAVELDADKNPIWTRENMQFGSVRR